MENNGNSQNISIVSIRKNAMKPEDVKKIKCDRCGVVVGLYQHNKGWRCPPCIWNERKNLIKWSKSLLSASDYVNGEGKVVKVGRMGMNALKLAVEKATSNE
jgi:ribosomal protein S27AE